MTEEWRQASAIGSGTFERMKKAASSRSRGAKLPAQKVTRRPELPFPPSLSPQLAVLATHPPQGEGWVHSGDYRCTTCGATFMSWAEREEFRKSIGNKSNQDTTDPNLFSLRVWVS